MNTLNSRCKWNGIGIHPLRGGQIHNCRFHKEISPVDFISNIVPVRKKNGQVRVCVDFRDLNAACLKDDFPLPISELIIDGNSGFWSHIIHGQKFWVKENAPGRRRATAKRTQKGAKGDAGSGGVFVEGRGGETRKFSYKEKVVGLPVEKSTMVDWTGVRRSTHLRKNLIRRRGGLPPTIRVSAEDKTKEGWGCPGINYLLSSAWVRDWVTTSWWDV